MKLSDLNLNRLTPSPSTDPLSLRERVGVRVKSTNTYPSQLPQSLPRRRPGESVGACPVLDTGVRVKVA